MSNGGNQKPPVTPSAVVPLPLLNSLVNPVLQNKGGENATPVKEFEVVSPATPTKSGANGTPPGTPTNSLSRNAQLDIRMTQGKVEKQLVGKFITPHVTISSIVAVDCGTSAAWAFYEIAAVHMENIYDGQLKVVTNNIFVPQIFSQDYGFNKMANTWDVQELPSSCYITSGRYYPCYGAILRSDDNDDGAKYYSECWEKHELDIILIGCTSFTAKQGPYCRSGANKCFKKSLFEYAVKNEKTKVFILLDIKKIGKREGEACDTESWSKLINRNNVFILAGFNGDHEAFLQLSDKDKRFLKNEAIEIQEQGRKNKLFIIDSSVGKIDLVKYFNKE